MVLMRNSDLERGEREGMDERDICVRYNLHERVIKEDRSRGWEEVPGVALKEGMITGCRPVQLVRSDATSTLARSKGGGNWPFLRLEKSVS